MRIEPMVAMLAGLTLLLHLVCISQYGYFRDEMYYLACGEHLDWGYVDQPPMIGLIAWLLRRTIGVSLPAIRILPAIANAALVVLTAAIARRLGASRFAQALAALCTMIAPLYLALGHFLSMNAFEPLLWMGMVYVAIGIFQGGSEKLWLLFGAAAGLGLENKHTTLFFGLAFVIGLLFSEHRRTLLRPWIWLGGLIALAIFMPNVIWEIRHHFATLELLNNIAHSHKNAPVTPLSFFTGQIVLMHPLTLPVWLAGLVWLLAQPRYRALGVTWIALFVEFVVMKGKVYYIGPSYPMLFAAGAIVIDRALAPRWRPAVAGALIAGGALILPMALPILPVETFIAYQRKLHVEAPRTESMRLGPLPQQYADMFGWPEMVAVVARAYNNLSPADRAKCAIFGQNYGQAGAIDLFGPYFGLPKAISGHQSYFDWGPRNYTGEVMLVMDDRREVLEKIFEHVEQVGVVHHPCAIPYENDKPVHLCRGLKMPMRVLWPKVKKWI
jgi:dolichyl-phosphate-mannose-protein mannosyltransferase